MKDAKGTALHRFTLPTFLLLSASFLAACGDSTSPEETRDPCGRVSVSITGEVSVGIRGCTGTELTITNISSNQDGRRESFDFDVRCVATSEQYTGRVYNIQYQSGSAVSFALEVNGRSCG